MIRFAIREVCERNGVHTAYQLMQRLGVPNATAYRIWDIDNKEFISKATIERLCRAFGCQPGDLIKLENGSPGAAAKPRARRTGSKKH